MATTKVEFEPDGVKYIYENQHVKFRYREFDSEGFLGYTMVFHKDGDGSQPPQPEAVPATVPVPQNGHHSRWGAFALGGVAVLGAVVIIGGSLASNVGSGGTDIPVDAVSFPAAAGLAGGGLAMMRMTAQ